MDCHRCGGFTLVEQIWDGRAISRAWRCVMCGEYVDEVIQRNRAWQLSKLRGVKTQSMTLYSCGNG